jgi:hypothetical protein
MRPRWGGSARRRRLSQRPGGGIRSQLHPNRGIVFRCDRYLASPSSPTSWLTALVVRPWPHEPRRRPPAGHCRAGTGSDYSARGIPRLGQAHARHNAVVQPGEAARVRPHRGRRAPARRSWRFRARSRAGRSLCRNYGRIRASDGRGRRRLRGNGHQGCRRCVRPSSSVAPRSTESRLVAALTATGSPLARFG